MPDDVAPQNEVEESLLHQLLRAQAETARKSRDLWRLRERLDAQQREHEAQIAVLKAGKARGQAAASAAAAAFHKKEEAAGAAADLDAADCLKEIEAISSSMQGLLQQQQQQEQESSAQSPTTAAALSTSLQPLYKKLQALCSALQKAQAPAAPPAAPPSTSANTEALAAARLFSGAAAAASAPGAGGREVLWWYRDDASALRGPFGAARMLRWWLQGVLVGDLQVAAVVEQPDGATPPPVAPLRSLRELIDLVAGGGEFEAEDTAWAAAPAETGEPACTSAAAAAVDVQHESGGAASGDASGRTPSPDKRARMAAKGGDQGSPRSAPQAQRLVMLLPVQLHPLMLGDEGDTDAVDSRKAALITAVPSSPCEAECSGAVVMPLSLPSPLSPSARLPVSRPALMPAAEEASLLGSPAAAEQMGLAVEGDEGHAPAQASGVARAEPWLPGSPAKLLARLREVPRLESSPIRSVLSWQARSAAGPPVATGGGEGQTTALPASHPPPKQSGMQAPAAKRKVLSVASKLGDSLHDALRSLSP